jgi:hypothetical protein
MEMDAGRKYSNSKFLKWVHLNHKFIMKKIPRTRRDLTPNPQRTMNQSRNIGNQTSLGL